MSEKFTDLVHMQRQAVKKHAQRDLFGTKKEGQWTWITYQDFGSMVDAARGGLAKAGISHGDTVAIIAANRVEWAVMAYATYGLGARFAPMYEHQLPDDWKYILSDSGSKLLLVSNREIYEQVQNWPSEIKTLQRVYGIDLDDNHPRSYASLLAAGRKEPTQPVAIDPDSICGFIYTSGTTGKPKGVLLSHANLTSNVNAVHEIFPLSTDDISVSFLPWAHSFGQTCELHVMLSMGARVAFAESVEKLVDNFGEVKPTIMVSVPRIFNKIYDGLNKKMNEAGGLKKKMFQAAIANAALRKQLDAVGKRSAWAELKHRMFDRLIFSKVRERFGGRLRYAFSGGAALSPEVAEFIDNVGIMVYEGYGLTETSPIACANWRGTRRIGTVGKPIPGVEIRLDTSMVDDDSGDGEIVVKGPNVMKGYHNLPEETTKVLTEDGAFRTGDRGHFDQDGFLRITGRIKEQYKLENGKYVVPSPLEEQLQLSPFIQQIYVDGANRLFNAALILPEQQALKKWAAENNIETIVDEMLKDERVKDLFMQELAKYSKEFKGYERVKAFAFIDEEFSTDNGMLTPKLSLKRRKVAEKYSDVLDSLWTKRA